MSWAGMRSALLEEQDKAVAIACVLMRELNFSFQISLLPLQPEIILSSRHEPDHGAKIGDYRSTAFQLSIRRVSEEKFTPIL